ncbi:type II toxin-antitoxin system PemK/MazF family toxin [Dactylococcopsis salina]|uniref:PemK-like protein n=1 Tax=Dactylococcopsis salina (strain PCC 8305) TaxID=13035 RepID=K9YW88_DACS8|nr:type II toxin-antitoxin system PemK/MazF family toxin [Dactylococcopsis salina]AFZ50383.1 PemK-like protein [Dactylococcopsis salina PCC 8305]
MNPILYNQFEVVVVPFPFTDRNAAKRRPALILSEANAFNTTIGHSVMAMITTATHTPWPLDVPIQDLATAGLRVPSIIRMKLFTLDHGLVLKKVGSLSLLDQIAVKKSLQQLFE